MLVRARFPTAWLVNHDYVALKIEVENHGYIKKGLVNHDTMEWKWLGIGPGIAPL